VTATTELNVWRARPVLANLVRFTVLAVPLAASLVAVLVVASMLEPRAARTWGGLLSLLVIALGVSVVVERAVRRFLPVAVLLRLTMVFPDRAPSRLRVLRSVARQAPPRQLLWTNGSAAPLSTEDLVLRLVGGLTAHDRRTRGHSERVRVLTELLAEELELEEPARERLRWAALLHDIGKMGVSPTVLNKPGPLDTREYDTVKEHPASGAALAAPLMPWLGEWGDGILDHHERYDGTGYPNGKSGQEISTAGRIIAVVDAFETMTAARPYKKAVGTRTARAELVRCAGTHFDPSYVRAFLAISLPRVLWAMGPLAFLVQLPFVRSLAEVGARAGSLSPQSAVATGAAGAAAVIAAGAATVGASAPQPPEPPVAEAAAESSGPGSSLAFAEVSTGGPSSYTVHDSADHLVRRHLATGTGSSADSGRTPGGSGDPDPTAATGPGDQPAAGQAPAPGAVGWEADRTAPGPASWPGQPAQPPAPATSEPAPATRTTTSGPARLDSADPEPTREPVSAPGVTIVSGPPETTTSRTATFRLRAHDGEQLQCLITRGITTDDSLPGLRPCADTVTYTDLETGLYQFRVRPQGSAQEWAEWTWEVVEPG
jgi:putative nucleotidyltransferase with HDIG domain